MKWHTCPKNEEQSALLQNLQERNSHEINSKTQESVKNALLTT